MNNEFRNLLDNVETVTIDRKTLQTIENRFKDTGKTELALMAINKIFSFMSECRDCQVDALTREFSKNGFILGGLEMANDILLEHAAKQRYAVIDLLDDRIKQAAEGKEAVA